ncbi:hypothetical protein FRAHR75_390042 [Frankia sp. Hr75.2]|nr:hypothetical protein FRAHR75_390042 [Frankia sp. Hr75.2]
MSTSRFDAAAARFTTGREPPFTRIYEKRRRAAADVTISAGFVLPEDRSALVDRTKPGRISV